MVRIYVCIGSACHVKGSYNVVNSFQQLIEEHQVSDKVEVNSIFCLGQCTQAVAVKIDDGPIYGVTGATARDFFTKQVMPLSTKL